MTPQKNQKGKDNVASSSIKPYVFILKDCSLFWDYPTFLELHYLFLYKMIGDASIFCLLFKGPFLKN
jgi:hypothetical protein